MVGPDYRRPAVETPASWRFAEEDAKELVNTRWWSQFADPVLNGLIEIALRENKDLKIAAARVEEFRGRYAAVRSPLFPSIGIGASVSGERSTERGQNPLPASAKNPFSLYQPGISASWELDLWGKTRRAIEAARADLVGTEEGKKAVILSLVSAVAGAYINLRDLDRQLEIAQQTAKSREEFYQIFTLRLKAGYVSDLELSQSKSEYERALAAIPVIEKSIAQLENGMSLLLGRNPGAIQRGEAIDALGLPAVPVGLPSDLLARRPDILQAEQELVSANAQIGVARARFFPSLSLTGLFGWESTQLMHLFTGPAQVWNWTASVDQPIFTAGAIAGQVKATEALRERALLQYQKAIQNAFRDVEDALIDLRRSRGQFDIQGRQVEALRTYACTARLRYENGYTSYIEVLDAERTLFDAEISHTQTRGRVLLSLIDLYKAMGAGWDVSAERTAVPLLKVTRVGVTPHSRQSLDRGKYSQQTKTVD